MTYGLRIVYFYGHQQPEHVIDKLSSNMATKVNYMSNNVRATTMNLAAAQGGEMTYFNAKMTSFGIF